MKSTNHLPSDLIMNNIDLHTHISPCVVVLDGAVIGRECDIAPYCYIDKNVEIGDRVTIKSGVQLHGKLHLGNDIFIGPNVTFVGEKTPISSLRSSEALETFIENGASIGGGATILPGLRIGKNSVVDAGAVVTRSIPPNAIATGNPARIVGYVNSSAIQTPCQVEKNGQASNLPSAGKSKLHQLPRIVDMRGALSVGEFERSVPFIPKRYFLVFEVPSLETRGEHAHRECHQFLICVRGSVNVVADDGVARSEFTLDRPELGLHLPPMVWGIQYKYSSDAILLVFASHYYDSADYIRVYDDFLAEVRAT